MGRLKIPTKYLLRWEPDRRSKFFLQSACTTMCRLIYDWNVVNWDIKQPIHHHHHLPPKRDLCVDETLLNTKGKSVMRQQIPSKVWKYNMKFCMLCAAASGYILQMNVYRGKTFDPTPRGQLQGTYIVYSLLNASNLINMGYHVICDSFFSSLEQTDKLLQCRPYLTGKFDL